MSDMTRIYARTAALLRKGLIRIPFAERLHVPQWLLSLCVYGWFVLVVVWFVAESFFGVGINPDEYYMYLCCRDYGEQPVAMLTFYVGWLVMRLFGDQIITMRLLMCFSVFVGVGVPCWYCWRRTRSIRWVLFIASCVLVATRSMCYEFYGWDMGPVMFVGPLITLIVSLYDRLTMRRVIGVGIFAALTILARVPTAVIDVPVCFIALWIATKGMPSRGRCFRRYAGMGILSFLGTFLLGVIVMKGSLSAYIASWRPENLITGHGLRDIVTYFWGNVKFDTRVIWVGNWVAKYAWASVGLLMFFSRRSRIVPGILCLGYLIWRKLMIPNCMYVPQISFDLAIILFPILYNCKARALGEKMHLAVDGRKIWTIVIFVLVMAIGSDRVMMRLIWFYMLPLLLVPLYPVRRGMIFWLLTLLTAPSFVYGVGSKIKNMAMYESADDILPHHKYILDNRSEAYKVYPLGYVMDVLNRENRRITTFSNGRYAASYLYETGKPYRLNVYHFSYRDEYALMMDDFTNAHDAVVVMDYPGMYTMEELSVMMRERKFYITATPGDYAVYERISPRQFLSVTDALE